MIKVLIADDEPKIRNGLFESIEWETLDMTIIGLVKDGEEALALAEKTKPDICLVDICMPVINGLELIEKLKAVNSKMIPIIITGHDEFDYAQQAVKLKAFDYILKPVAEEELLKVIQKAKTVIAENQEKEKRYEWAESQLKKNLPLLRAGFISEWLAGQLIGEELAAEFEFYDIKLGSRIGLIVLKTPGVIIINNQYVERERQLLLFAIQHIFEEYLEFLSPFVMTRDSSDNLVAVVTISDLEPWSNLKSLLEINIERSLGYQITVYQTAVEDGSAGIPFAYQEIYKNLHSEVHYPPVIKKVKSYIEGNYQDPELSLQKIAADLQLSLSYLSKLFKQEVGMSFIDYLIKIRIKEAIKLMNNPQLKIYEIAEQVGYNSQHYFCAAFKKVLGISPTDYRQKAI